jgi:nitroimidazol reductase NimA-like FMN-containing flavoprotein (pyridoxamine 5'-phosphate oxidase superfamily)
MAAAKKETKSRAAIRKEIIEFLDNTCAQVDPKPGKYSCGMIHRNALVLATSYKDIPRATPLEFFNEGLTLYIFGEPGGKIGNIRRNQRVSAAIYEQPMTHSKTQRSLQIFGIAELITVRGNPRLFRSKLKKWNMYAVAGKLFSSTLKEQNVTGKAAEAMVKKATETLMLIKIVPHHIIMRVYRPDFSGQKFEWKKDKK